MPQRARHRKKQTAPRAPHPWARGAPTMKGEKKNCGSRKPCTDNGAKKTGAGPRKTIGPGSFQCFERPPRKTTLGGQKAFPETQWAGAVHPKKADRQAQAAGVPPQETPWQHTGPGVGGQGQTTAGEKGRKRGPGGSKPGFLGHSNAPYQQRGQTPCTTTAGQKTAAT